jgi:hypothetical protein
MLLASQGAYMGWPPFVDDVAGHPVLPIHLPNRIVNVIGGSYTHAHTLPHPKRHKVKYTNFMAMNKQREMRFGVCGELVRECTFLSQLVAPRYRGDLGSENYVDP